MPLSRARSPGATQGGPSGWPGGQATTWLHARARLKPDLLIQSPPWVRGVFDHAWAAMEALARQVPHLPAALWSYLLDCEGGFVLIAPGESRYIAGPARIRQEPVQNVAFVSVEDLAHDNERPLHVIGHLVDHYLGCGGDAEGLWLSEGGGVTSGWKQAGERLRSLFSLGYGIDEDALSSVQDYFAQSLATYCRDRRRLNVADPQIYKWFRSTLWNKSFWSSKEL
jgi:hypothetical protein